MIAPPEHALAYPNVTDGARIDRPATFAADVVIVGSGAGGATAAARLRAAGLDVLLLEEGALQRTETFTTDPATMIRRLYRDAGTSMILGTPGIMFAEGRCVGGSTVINGGMSWRTPERVLTRWERDLALPDTGPRAMEPYFAEAERILHVEPNDEDTFGRNTRLFLRGAQSRGGGRATRSAADDHDVGRERRRSIDARAVGDVGIGERVLRRSDHGGASPSSAARRRTCISARPAQSTSRDASTLGCW